MEEAEEVIELEPRMQQAIAEPEALILRVYPGATFSLARDPEDCEVVLLKPMVDVDDRGPVMDLIVDRLVDFQTEEDLPLDVMIVRPEARNEAIRRAMKRATPPGPSGPRGSAGRAGCSLGPRASSPSHGRTPDERRNPLLLSLSLYTSASAPKGMLQ